MIGKIISIYVFLFARPFFAKFNKFLHRLALSGLGVLNCKSTAVSGEKAFLRKYLKNKKGVVIDVGANQGNYSIEALGFNPSIQIYAFEPHPITFNVLISKVEKRPNIVPVNMGMSASPGKLQLFDYPTKDGSSHASLFQDVITELHGAGSAVSHEVSLTTLDNFVSSQDILEIALLKIDTEGNELEVLRGG
jgi:FkbM family methyltransferase